MKKAVYGLLVVVLILAGFYYFVATSGPNYDNHPQRTFKAQDTATEGFINRSTFSNDCMLLLTMVQAVGGTQTGKFVFVWDLEKEKQICKISPQLLGFQLALSPDAQHFALNSATTTGSELTIHDTSTGKKVGQLPLDANSGVWEIAFLPDGETLLVLDGFPKVTAKVWNWKEEKEIISFPCRGLEMAVSADGRRIVSGGAISKPIAGGGGYGMGAMGFGMGGMGGGALPQNRNDDKARIYDVQTGKLLHELPGHQQGATQFAFSPDGAFVATGGGTPIVRIWNSETGGLVKTVDMFAEEDRAIRAITYSHDGARLAVSYAHAQPNVPTGFIGKLIYRLRGLLSQGGAATALISPTVLWDCSTWQPIHVYGLNQASTYSAFLPDDRGLVTIDLYGDVRWWNLP